MKKVKLALFGLACLSVGAAVFAQGNSMSVGTVAATVTNSVGNIARLITASSYVAGMAFVVGAIVKFKTHKENPTQIPIGTPIALLFVGAALIFVPTVFRVSGQTMFGASGEVSKVSGLTTFAK